MEVDSLFLDYWICDGSIKMKTTTVSACQKIAEDTVKFLKTLIKNTRFYPKEEYAEKE